MDSIQLPGWRHPRSVLHRQGCGQCSDQVGQSAEVETSESDNALRRLPVMLALMRPLVQEARYNTREGGWQGGSGTVLTMNVYTETATILPS